MREHKAGRGGGEYELINIHKRKIIGNVKCKEVGKVIKIVKAVEIVEIDWKGSMCVCAGERRDTKAYNYAGLLRPIIGQYRNVFS